MNTNTYGNVEDQLLEDIADLERENAGLRVEMERQAVCNGKGAEREAALLAKVEALERENAALRTDKERLDWLSTALGGYWACEHLQHRSRISRTYIDAGMADNPTPAELKDK